MVRMGKNLSDSEITEIMKALDENGDGVINFEEFLKGMIMAAKPPGNSKKGLSQSDGKLLTYV